MLLLAGLLAAAPVAAGAEPLELFNNRLFLPVTINGRPAVALLDSGAEMTVLDDDFAEQLGLVPTGSATAHGSGQRTMQARFAEHVALDAAGLSLEQNVAILDLGDVAARLIGRPLDLILGREFFDNGRWRIDMTGGTIEPVAEDASPGGVRLALGEHRGTPTIPASVEGQAPVQALFDLGNGGDLLIGRAYAERLGLTAPDRIVERRSGGGLGGAVERDIVLLGSVSLAGREFRDVQAAIDRGETASDLNIGNSILRHFVITTDFPGGAIRLEQRPRQ